jgi:hypothetical protein
MRQAFAAKLVTDLQARMAAERTKFSGANAFAKAMNNILQRRHLFVRFLEDVGIFLTNNVAERALRWVEKAGFWPALIGVASGR